MPPKIPSNFIEHHADILQQAKEEYLKEIRDEAMA
jgi:hypothetical protein